MSSLSPAQIPPSASLPRSENQSRQRRHPVLPALAAAVVIGAVLVRLGLLSAHGLWADELFSLAMATGHSLEHPAAQADPVQGDYVESPEPVPAAALRRYVQHGPTPTPPRQVLRAVFLSDTSPPLYYLLLWGWTSLVGTSDVALRMLSLLFAIGCLPLMWSFGRRIGGRRGALPALLLFAASPLSIYYSTEGRMYSLLWFWVLAVGLLSIQLPRDRFRAARLAAWVLCSIGGFLTHYFFLFPWTACVAWLLLQPGRLQRTHLLLAIAACLGAILPWYIALPKSLAQWRVSQDWLYWPIDGFHHAIAPIYLVLTYFTRGVDGWIGRSGILLLVGLLVGLCFAMAKMRHTLFTGPRALVWLWLLAAVAGPIVFDLVKGTHAAAVPRYAIAGLPAALLLLALGISRLRRPLQIVALLLIALYWQAGIRWMYAMPARQLESYRQIARELTEHTPPPELVIVHSIPSGVIGLARYLDEDMAVYSWVEQLGERRVPDDVQRAIAGRRQIAVVNVHAIGAPANEIDWLQQHARLVAERPATSFNNSTLYFFVPRVGTHFAFPLSP